jgi:hypothetical protein
MAVSANASKDSPIEMFLIRIINKRFYRGSQHEIAAFSLNSF